MQGRIRKRHLPSSGEARYQVLVRVNGRERSFGTFPRKKDAEARLRLALEKVAAGTTSRPSRTWRFDEYAAFWLQSRSGRVKPRTYDDYEVTVRRHLLPHFGTLPLTEITREDVLALQDGMKFKLSPRTCNKTLTILRMMLKVAQGLEYMDRNPALFVDPITQEKQEMDYLRPDEVARLLEAAGEAMPIIATAVFTGLRPSELFALRWRDVTPEYVRVSKSKTDAGRRTVPIGADLAATLEPLRRGSDDLVFPSKAGTPIDPHNFGRRVFHPARKAAGLRHMRPYDLRHTYATMMIAEGVNPMVLQRRMGHTSIQVTYDNYGHLMPDVDRGIEDKIIKRVTDSTARGADNTRTQRGKQRLKR